MDRENSWQLQCAELRERGAYLYKSKAWSDCELQIDHVTIKAHKLILAMSSPVLAKMLYGSHIQKSPVPIYDVRVDVFNILLEYIYSDNLNVNCSKDAIDLYYAARKLRLPYVAKECIKYLNVEMGPDNMSHIYSSAWENNDRPLLWACEKIFTTRTKEVIKEPSFYNLSMSMVSRLFSLDPLNIDNELDLYNAAVEYVRHIEINEIKKAHKEEYRRKRKERAEKCRMENNQTEENMFEIPICSTPIKKAKLDHITENNNNYVNNTNNENNNNSPTEPREDTGHDDAASEESGSSRGSSSYCGPARLGGSYIRDQNQKLRFRELITPIRFLSLTPQQFAKCKTFCLLSTYEALCLSMNIASRRTTFEVPEGLSRSMVPRTLITHKERTKLAAVFRGIIPNFRYINKYESQPFYIRNMAWILTMLIVQDYVVLIARGFLETDCVEQEEWVNNAKIRFKFCTHKPVPKQLNKIGLINSKLFGDQIVEDQVVWSVKVNRSSVFCPEYGFIDDCNTVTYKLYIDTTHENSPRTDTTNSNLKSVTESNSSNIILKVMKSPVVTTSASTLPSATASTVSHNAIVNSNRSTTPISQDSTIARSSTITQKMASALPTSKFIPSNTNGSNASNMLAQNMSALHSAPALVTNTASRPLTSKTSPGTSVLPQSKSSAANISAGTKPPTVMSPAVTKPTAPNISRPVGGNIIATSSETIPQPSHASVASKALPPTTVTNSIKSPMMTSTLSSLAATLPRVPSTMITRKPYMINRVSKNAASSVAAPKTLSHPLSTTQSCLTPNATAKSTLPMASNPMTAPKLPSSTALATKTGATTGSSTAVPSQSPRKNLTLTTTTALKFPPPSPANIGMPLLSQKIEPIVSASPNSVKSDVKEVLARQSQPITSTFTSAESTAPLGVGPAPQHHHGSSSMLGLSVSSGAPKIQSSGSDQNSSKSSSTGTNSIMPLTPYSYIVKADSNDKPRLFPRSPSKNPENLSPLSELNSLIASLKVPESFTTKKSSNDAEKKALTGQKGKVALPSDETNIGNYNATSSSRLPVTEYPSDVEMVDMTLTVCDPSTNSMNIDPYDDKPSMNGIKLLNSNLSMPELSEVDSDMVDTAQADRDHSICDINDLNETLYKNSPEPIESVGIYEQEFKTAPPVWYPKTTAMVSSQPLHAVTRAWPARPTVSKTGSISPNPVPITTVESPSKTIIVHERPFPNAISENCSNISTPSKLSSNFYISPQIKKQSSPIKDCKIYEPRKLREIAVAVFDSIIQGRQKATEEYRNVAISPKTPEFKKAKQSRSALPTSKLIPSNTNGSNASNMLAQNMSALHSAAALVTNTASRPLTSKTSPGTSVLPQSKSSAANISAGTKPPTVISPAVTKPQESTAPNISRPVGGNIIAISSVTIPQPSLASVASKALPPTTVTNSIKSPMMTSTLSSLAATLPRAPSPMIKRKPYMINRVSTNAASSVTAPKTLSHPLSTTQSCLTPNATAKSTLPMASNPMTAPKLPSSTALATKTGATTGSSTAVPSQSPRKNLTLTTTTALKFPPPSPANIGMPLLSQKIEPIVSASPNSVKSDVKEVLARQSQPITSTFTSAESTAPLGVGPAPQHHHGSSSMLGLSVSSGAPKIQSSGSDQNSSKSSSTGTNSIMPLTPYSYIVKADSNDKPRLFPRSPSKNPENLSPLSELNSLIASLKVPESFTTKKSSNDAEKKALTGQKGKVALPSDETNIGNYNATSSSRLPVTEYPSDVEMVDMTLTVCDPSTNSMNIDPYDDKPSMNGIKLLDSNLSMPELSEVDSDMVDTAQAGRDHSICDTNDLNETLYKNSPEPIESVGVYEQEFKTAPPVWYLKTTAMVSSQPLHAVTRAWPARPTVSKTGSISPNPVPITTVESPSKTIIVHERPFPNAIFENCSNISTPSKLSSNFYISPQIKKQSSPIKDCKIYEPRKLREIAVAVFDSMIQGRQKASEEYRNAAISPKTPEFKKQSLATENCKIYEPRKLREIAVAVFNSMIQGRQKATEEYRNTAISPKTPEFKKQSLATENCKIYGPRKLREIAVTVVQGRQKPTEEYRNVAKSSKTCLTAFDIDNSHLLSRVDAEECFDTDDRSDSIDFDIDPFFQPPTLMEIAISGLGLLITKKFDHVIKSEKHINMCVEPSLENNNDGAICNLKQPPTLMEIAISGLGLLVTNYFDHLFKSEKHINMCVEPSPENNEDGAISNLKAPLPLKVVALNFLKQLIFKFD